MSKEEYYYLMHSDNKLFFAGYKKTEKELVPIWTEKEDAKSYKEMESLRIQRHLSKNQNTKTFLVLI